MNLRLNCSVFKSVSYKFSLWAAGVSVCLRQFKNSSYLLKRNKNLNGNKSKIYFIVYGVPPLDLTNFFCSIFAVFTMQRSAHFGTCESHTNTSLNPHQLCKLEEWQPRQPCWFIYDPILAITLRLVENTHYKFLKTCLSWPIFCLKAVSCLE